MNTKIQEKLKLLPDKPGVYKMFNAQGELIYVGKAVNLKNRVRQYFQSQKNHTAKVRAMVSNICDFDFVIVTNETEALNLESNLIKQNMLCMLNVFLCITHLFLSPILMYYLLYMQQMQ